MHGVHDLHPLHPYLLSPFSLLHPLNCATAHWGARQNGFPMPIGTYVHQYTIAGGSITSPNLRDCARLAQLVCRKPLAASSPDKCLACAARRPGDNRESCPTARERASCAGNNVACRFVNRTQCRWGGQIVPLCQGISGEKGFFGVPLEMSPEDRRALCQAGALPILTRMKARFDEVRPTLRPTAKLNPDAAENGLHVGSPSLNR
jgi:hypothetical protein